MDKYHQGVASSFRWTSQRDNPNHGPAVGVELHVLDIHVLDFRLVIVYQRRVRRLLQADGNARAPSESSLYFCNRAGDVYRLPTKIEGETAKPELVVPAVGPPSVQGP